MDEFKDLPATIVDLFFVLFLIKKEGREEWELHPGIFYVGWTSFPPGYTMPHLFGS